MGTQHGTIAVIRGPVVWLLGVVVMGFALLLGAFFISRWQTVTVRVDQDGGPVPAWLPIGASDLHLRGTRVSIHFSGRCRQAEVEAWAQEWQVPLKKRGRGAVYQVDYGKVPKDWTKSGFYLDESLRTHFEDAEEIIWEQRRPNGGGILLYYLPVQQSFHGSRELW